MIIFFFIEFLIICATSIMFELVCPSVGFGIVGVFALTFSILSLLNRKEKEKKIEQNT